MANDVLNEKLNRIVANIFSAVGLNQEDIEFIKQNINYICNSSIESYYIPELIAATNDDIFIRDCIESEDLNLSRINKANLVARIRDIDYIKNALVDEKFGFDSSNRFSILQRLTGHIRNFSKDIVEKQACADFVEACLRDKKIGLEGYQKEYLIPFMKDLRNLKDWQYAEYLIQAFKDREIGLDSNRKVNLIEQLKKLETASDVITIKRTGTEYTQYEFWLLDFCEEDVNLNPMDKVKLIGDTKNAFLIEGSVYNKSLKFSSLDKIHLIKKLQEVESVSQMDYYYAVLGMVKEKSLGLDSKEIFELIKSAKNPANGKGSQEYSLDNYLSLVYTVIKNPEIIFTNEQTKDLIVATESTKLVKNIVMQTSFFSKKEKLELIADTQNLELAEEFLKNGHLKLGDNWRADLITKMIENQNSVNSASTKSPEEVVEESKRCLEACKKYIEDDSFHFDNYEKAKLITWIGDKDYLKKSIESLSCGIEVTADLIIELGDREYAQQCLENESLKLGLNEQATLLKFINNLGKIYAWNKGTKVIDSISELSLEDLEQNPDIERVKIVRRDENSIYYVDYYTKDEYVAIQKQFDEWFSDVEQPIKDDKQSELTAFLKIYKKIADEIAYDDYAVSEAGERDSELQRTSRNLKSILSDNKSAVCAGFAEILRNALACKGIESRMIVGLSEAEDDNGHAWNQVKIGGVWFNVDLTWDKNTIKSMEEAPIDVLKTDEQFQNHSRFCINRSKSEKKCTISITELMENERNTEEREANNAVNLENSIMSLGINNKIQKSEISTSVRNVKSMEQQNVQVETEKLPQEGRV